MAWLGDLEPSARRSLDRNGVVFRQGDRSLHLHQVVRGRVRLIRILETGERVAMASAGPGQTFAEAALFSPVHHCEAVAEEAGEVLLYDAAAVRRRIADDPGFAALFCGYLAGQVRDLRATVEILNIRSAPARVLAWLRLRARGAPPAVEVASWTSVAAEIGLTREAVYRALAALARRGAVRREGAVVVLPPGARGG